MPRTIPFAAAAIALLAAVAPLSAGAARPAAPAGAIVFTSERSNDGRELYVVNGDGSGLRRLTYNTLFERQAAWSPDRTQVAFSAADASGNFDIYLINTDGSSQQRLTADPARDDSPQWTADGRIVFQRDDRAWIMNADGTGAAELPTGPGDALTPTASPKGDDIAFASSRGGATWAIYVMRANGKALLAGRQAALVHARQRNAGQRPLRRRRERQERSPADGDAGPRRVLVVVVGRQRRLLRA
jgi:Tol biopolymer transport system component